MRKVKMRGLTGKIPSEGKSVLVRHADPRFISWANYLKRNVENLGKESQVDIEKNYLVGNYIY